MVDLLYIPGLIILALQIACIVHVIRNDRSWWWILAIVFLQVIGVVLYFLIEVAAKASAGETRRAVPFGSVSGTGKEKIAALERLVEQSPTVENQARLAAALLRRGKTKRAIEIYESCLDGVYADDKTLWYEVAEAYHADHRPQLALDYLRRLEAGQFRDYRDRRELLTALSLERLGQLDDAIERLEHLVSTFAGQEANYHFARLLLKRGEGERARRVVAGMLERSRTHDARYRRRESAWYEAAKNLVKG